MLPFKINLTGAQAFKVAILVFGIALGWIGKGHFHQCPDIIAGSDTSYVDIPQPQDSSGYEPQIIIFENPVNQDSIYQAAKDYWYKIFEEHYKEDTSDYYYQGNFRYVAKLSLNKPDVKGKISFNSRIPLDPEGYFLDDLTVKQKIITNTITQTETITYNPDFFFEGSVRVDTSLTYSLMAGVYPVSYKYLKSFIKAGATYNERWRVQAELGARIEF